MKSINSFFIAIFMSSILGIYSCSKILIEPNKENTPRNVFNQVTDDIKNKYVFFDYKGVNWESVTQKYASQINDDMNDQQLYNVMSEMMSSLKDGHTSLYTPLDTFRYKYDKDSKVNFNENFVLNTYLKPNDFNTTETIQHCKLSNGDVGYIYYSSFENDLSVAGMDNILTNFKNTKGLIIDLRNNTGGSNDNIYRIMEHFVSTKTLVGYSSQKASSKTNDFTTPYEIYIEPKGVKYDKPIIILTNNTIYSSAQILTGFMSQLSNVKLLGDKTGGGTGVPSSNQLPNGWLYRFSASYITLANGDQFENGLNPDIYVSTGDTEESMGKDALIESAITILK